MNALCARLVTRTISKANGAYDPKLALGAYVDFMTKPGSHNDTYAESFHRDFFLNWVKGVAPEKCAGPEGHNTAQIGGFVMLPPVILSQVRVLTCHVTLNPNPSPRSFSPRLERIAQRPRRQR